MSPALQNFEMPTRIHLDEQGSMAPQTTHSMQKLPIAYWNLSKS